MCLFRHSACLENERASCECSLDSVHVRLSSSIGSRPVREPFLCFVFGLVAQSEIVQQLAVTRDVRLAEILQQTATFTNHHEQTTTAVMVFGIFAEMICEIVDARRQKRDLN